MHLAEDAGRGIDEIEDGMAGALLEAPMFLDTGRAVVVELPTRAIATPQERAWILELERRRLLEPSDKLLLVRTSRGEVLTNSAVRDLLGVDSREARAMLRRLRDAGILRQDGERGGASYTLEDGFAPTPRSRLDDAVADAVVMREAARRPLSNADIRALLGVDAADAKRRLDDMVARGLLRRTGRARGTRYTPASSTT
jgi:ATP-dependent DNA helicase RecG